MAKKSQLEKWKKNLVSPKFSTRRGNRCSMCGRSGAYYRKFGVCRICLRSLASKGEIPGMKKASW